MAGAPRGDGGGEPGNAALQQRDEAPAKGPGAFVLALTFAAGISGLLFGCKSTSPHRRLGRHG